MPAFADITQYCIDHKDTVVSLALLALAVFQAIKQKLTIQEALQLMANTLKDETKMPAGQFSAETVTKLQQVSTAVQAGQAAVQEVRQALGTFNQAAAAAPQPIVAATGTPVVPQAPAVIDPHASDIKVASVGGKPIYLSQVTGIGSQAAAALAIVRGLFGR